MTRVIAPADGDDSVSEALETGGGDWSGPQRRTHRRSSASR